MNKLILTINLYALAVAALAAAIWHFRSSPLPLTVAVLVTGAVSILVNTLLVGAIKHATRR